MKLLLKGRRSVIYETDDGNIKKVYRDSYIEDIKREAKALKKLSKYNHFPKLLDEGDNYIVMTYVGRKIKKEEMKNFKSQALEILKELECSGIEHRDAESMHWMVSHDDVLYLIDFGACSFKGEDNPCVRKFKQKMTDMGWVSKLFESRELAQSDSKKKYRTIVNLGAWRGKHTIRFARKCDLVVSVEPVRENYEALIGAIIEKKLTNVIPVFAAIGKESGIGKIHLSKISQGHSMYDMDDFDDATLTRKVMTITWDDLMDFLGIDRVDYAKVDIEGAEEDLLVGMTKVFPKRMLIEQHKHHGVTDIDNLLKLLEERDYVLTEKLGKYLKVKLKCL